MAQHGEPMDVDCMDSDFDNKENTSHHSNVLPCTEKGYEELDVSELNMKLRYSITPAASPMSKSYTACLDNRNLDSDESLNYTIENSLTRSLNSTITKNDSVVKSLKALPLQSLPTEKFVDGNRNSTVLRQLDSTISGEGNNITVTISGANDDENLSLPSSSSSAIPTPEATTPTKDIQKNDGDSPIIRGLKSVLNMFRTSQSPIPPADNEIAKQDILSPEAVTSTASSTESKTQVAASTPIAAHRCKDGNTSKKSSPNFKDSIVFNDDLEKELQWKDETTILFSQEKIPIHKLFFQQSKSTSNSQKNTNEVTELVKEGDANLNNTVEYMDISYIESHIGDKTMTEVHAVQPENKEEKSEHCAVESDSEFQDCETTFTKETQEQVIKEIITDNNNEHKINNIETIVDNKRDILNSTMNLINNECMDVTKRSFDDVIADLTETINKTSDVLNEFSKGEHSMSPNISNSNNASEGDVTKHTACDILQNISENVIAITVSDNAQLEDKQEKIADIENKSLESLNSDFIQTYENQNVIEVNKINNANNSAVSKTEVISECLDSIPNNNVNDMDIDTQIQVNNSMKIENTDPLILHTEITASNTKESLSQSTYVQTTEIEPKAIDFITIDKKTVDITNEILPEDDCDAIYNQTLTLETKDTTVDKMDKSEGHEQVDDEGIVSQIGNTTSQNQLQQPFNVTCEVNHSEDNNDTQRCRLYCDDGDVRTTEEINTSLSPASCNFNITVVDFQTEEPADIPLPEEEDIEKVTEVVSSQDVSSNTSLERNHESVDIVIPALTVNDIEPEATNNITNDDNLVETIVTDAVNSTDVTPKYDMRIDNNEDPKINNTIDLDSNSIDKIQTLSDIGCTTVLGNIDQIVNTQDEPMDLNQTNSKENVLFELCNQNIATDIKNETFDSSVPNDINVAKVELHVGPSIEKDYIQNTKSVEINESVTKENGLSDLGNQDIINNINKSVLEITSDFNKIEEMRAENVTDIEDIKLSTELTNDTLDLSKSKNIDQSVLGDGPDMEVIPCTEIDSNTQGIETMEINQSLCKENILSAANNGINECTIERSVPGNTSDIKNIEDEMHRIDVDMVNQKPSEKVTNDDLDVSFTKNIEKYVTEIEQKEEIIYGNVNSNTNQYAGVDVEKNMSNEKPCEEEILTNTVDNNEDIRPETAITDEEIVISENNSPYVSVMPELEIPPELNPIENFEELENPFETKSNVPSSPPISSKGYNFNFDEIDDPFASKTKIRLSPPLDTPNKENEVIENVNIGKSEVKNVANNRRKSQPIRSKPAVLNKKKLNSTFHSKSSVSSKGVGNDHVLKSKDNMKPIEAPPIVTSEDKVEIVEDQTPLDKATVNDNEQLEQKQLEMIESMVLDQKEEKLLNAVVEQKISNESFNILSNEKEHTSSSEQSVYYSVGASSSDSNKSRNVFNLPEIHDVNFVTKSKMRQSSPLNLETDNPFATRTKIVNSPDCSMIIQKNITNPEENSIHMESKQLSPIEKYSEDKTETEAMEKDSSANISGVNSSLMAIDDKNNTVREVNTEDEDTEEGPFLDTEDNLDKMSDFDNENVDMMQFNDLPTQEHDDNEGGELFIDAEAFEFLLNQNKSNMVSDSGKESLFLKFDPLFAKRISSEGVVAALNRVQKRQSTPTKVRKSAQKSEVLPIAGPSTLNTTYDGEQNISLDNNDDLNVTVSKPMMVVTPAVNPIVTPRKSITPTRSNRRSITFTSPAIAVIDRLLSLSASNSPLAQETTITQVSREQNEADLALTQLRELLAEKEIQVYNLRSESKDLKDRLSSLESQMRILETDGQNRLKKINELNDRLVEKTKINKSMAAVVEEYERTIASLIAEIEQDKKRNAEERMRLISERDEQTAHLASMEVSFSDLHSKYEKSKQVILSCKANEDTYKKTIKDFEENLTKMQNNYELLKQHATSKLNHANQELEKINRAHEAEVLKMNAMIKRKELHITSLEETLTQKTKANEELTAICDELINKVG